MGLSKGRNTSYSAKVSITTKVSLTTVFTLAWQNIHGRVIDTGGRADTPVTSYLQVSGLDLHGQPRSCS